MKNLKNFYISLTFSSVILFATTFTYAGSTAICATNPNTLSSYSFQCCEVPPPSPPPSFWVSTSGEPANTCTGIKLASNSIKCTKTTPIFNQSSSSNLYDQCANLLGITSSSDVYVCIDGTCQQQFSH